VFCVLHKLTRTHVAIVWRYERSPAQYFKFAPRNSTPGPEYKIHYSYPRNFVASTRPFLVAIMYQKYLLIIGTSRCFSNAPSIPRHAILIIFTAHEDGALGFKEWNSCCLICDIILSAGSWKRQLCYLSQKMGVLHPSNEGDIKIYFFKLSWWKMETWWPHRWNQQPNRPVLFRSF
jgi:hypothetical protein